MYQAIRIDKTAKVIYSNKEDIKEVCVVPEYYLQDLGIASAIAKLLNEGSVKIDLNV